MKNRSIEAWTTAVKRRGECEEGSCDEAASASRLRASGEAGHRTPKVLVSEPNRSSLLTQCRQQFCSVKEGRTSGRESAGGRQCGQQSHNVGRRGLDTRAKRQRGPLVLRAHAKSFKNILKVRIHQSNLFRTVRIRACTAHARVESKI